MLWKEYLKKQTVICLVEPKKIKLLEPNVMVKKFKNP